MARSWPSVLCSLWLCLGCELRTLHADPAASSSPPAPSSGLPAAAPTATAHGADVTASPSPTVRRLPKELELASWNIEWLNRRVGRGPVKRTARDLARLASYASKLDADVVALQEVDGPEAARHVFAAEVYDFHFAEGGGAQRAGFAFKRELEVTRYPDLAALDVGGVRRGAELGINTAQGEVRLLSVHLKSDCFEEALSHASKGCKKLALQLPVLETWIDEQASHGRLFAVLGDFNRRLFASPDDPFWRELDDGQPAGSDLDSPTRTHELECGRRGSRDQVDHLVFGRDLYARVEQASFRQLRYTEESRAVREVLSDHCPLAVRVRFE